VEENDASEVRGVGSTRDRRDRKLHAQFPSRLVSRKPRGILIIAIVGKARRRRLGSAARGAVRARDAGDLERAGERLMKIVDGHLAAPPHGSPSSPPRRFALDATRTKSPTTRGWTEAQNSSTRPATWSRTGVRGTTRSGERLSALPSAAEDHFYIEGGKQRPAHWMGMAKLPGPVDGEKKGTRRLASWLPCGK